MWQLPTAVAGLCFALEYANLGRFVNRKTILLLSIPWLVQVGLTLSGYFRPWGWQLGEGMLHNFRARTPAAQVLYLYGFLLALIVPIIFGFLFFRSPRHRWPAGLCLLGQILTRVVLLLGERGSTKGMLVSTFFHTGFVPVTAAYALALFRFRLLELIPIARKTIFQQMYEGMLLLDREERIVDLNPSAEKILGLSAASARGTLLPERLGLPPLVMNARNVREPQECEIRIDGEDGERFYVLHLSPLNNETDYYLGRVVLFHDVTTQRRGQAQILEQQRTMAMLQERVRLARDLHDGIAQVLGYMKMQGEAARSWLNRGSSEKAEDALKSLVTAAQDSLIEVRDYISSAHAQISSDLDFRSYLQEYLARFSTTYHLRAELDAPADLPAQMMASSVRTQVLRIVQEALANARKHAEASCVRVILRWENGRIQVAIEDDGKGFDVMQSSPNPAEHFGLEFMRQRALEIGGRLQVHSSPGQGTRITMEFALEPEVLR